MIGEVGKVVAEKIIKESSKEIVKTTVKDKTAVDIRKRIDIDVVQKKTEFSSKGVDTKKRISPKDVVKGISETFKKEISEAINAYLTDLKSKSEFASTITKELKWSDLKLQPKEVVQRLRKEFENNKKKLIEEWEKKNNKEWPRYKNDVVNSKGIVIRKAGDYYDAHHIHPLCLGGKNEASNITPLSIDKHVDIHKGSCRKLIDLFKKGA